MGNYSSFWLSHPAGLFKKKSRHVVRIRILLIGLGTHSYFVREEAPINAKKYKIVEEFRIEGNDGAREVIQKFLSARTALAQAHTEIILEDPLCLYPSDAEAHRAKLPCEQIMDAAMLAVELDDFDRADELLDSLGAQQQNNIFAHTIRRRSAAIQAALLKTMNEQDVSRTAHLSRAHHAADAVIRCADDGNFYGFGENYRRLETQLTAAYATQAEYWLTVGDAAEALAACQRADDTCYSTTDNSALKARALFALGRNDEAYALVKGYNFHCLTEITESADYKKYLERSAAEASNAERIRIEKIKVLIAANTLLSASEILAWQQHTERLDIALPATFEHWLRESNSRNLIVTQPGNEDDISEEYTTEYPFISAEYAREQHEAMIDWIHLHDKSTPELAAEIHQYIADSGIDPDKMLPVVAVTYTPDCFLLRLDGPEKTERGAIYFWSHDEAGTFDRIADDMPGFYTWLESRAREGNVFSL